MGSRASQEELDGDVADAEPRPHRPHLRRQKQETSGFGCGSGRGSALERSKSICDREERRSSGDPEARQGDERARGHLLVRRRKVLFVAGDGRTAIFRFGRGPDRKIGTRDDTVRTLLDTERWGSFDPEGVTFRAQHGRVNMLIWSDAGMHSGNANAIFEVKVGQDHRFGTQDDVMSTFSTSAPPFAYTESEGVLYDPRRKSLFLVSSQQCPIFETTLSGAVVRRIRTSAICAPGTATTGFSDLVFAPGTDGSARRLYLTDHGMDHDPARPDDNDGKIYQVKIVARP